MLQAIEHMHFSCFKLCRQAFGGYFPVAGNVAIFCHYPEEFETLTRIREELTDASDHINKKYFLLRSPIVIKAADDIPETTYTYLYIRRPDPYRAQVGNLDFVLGKERYQKIKKLLLGGETIKGARLYPGATLEMIELYDPDADVLGYAIPEKWK
jgi:hypothetical protein